MLLLDWQKIVLNLNRAGLSYKKISDRAHCDARRIGNLARAEVYEPKISVGLELLNLHERFCPDQHNIKLLKIGAR